MQGKASRPSDGERTDDTTTHADAVGTAKKTNEKKGEQAIHIRDGRITGSPARCTLQNQITLE
jgi:hypothetical protein